MSSNLSSEIHAENVAHLSSKIEDIRSDLIEAHDALRLLTREHKAEFPHVCGFLSAGRAEIMSAIDSLNVAERHLS